MAFEIPLAAAAAAALAMLPPKMGQNGGRGSSLTGNLHENYYEVVNILGSVFNADPARHVVLSTVTYGRQPDQLQGNNCPSFQVDIKGYGKGLLVMAAA